jgi:hypothetical protein
MEEGRGHGHTELWTWAALSCDALLVALSLVALRLAETSNTNRQEEVALLMFAGVPVAACAAVALSVQAIRSSRGKMNMSKLLTTTGLFVVVVPLGLFAAYLVFFFLTL